MRQLVLRRPGRALVMPVQHLSATEIAAFIDSTLSADARAAAELHLSGCGRCRDELASCMRLATTAPSRSSARTWVPLIGSIAAALLIVAVLRSGHQRLNTDLARERATSPSSSAPAVSPSNDQTVARRDLRLVWRRDAAAVGYRVVVTDSAGEPVWRSDDVTDTSAAPSPTVPLSSGSRYFWHVDALHADGSTTPSTTAAFRVSP